MAQHFVTSRGDWRNVEKLHSRSFVCGYCSNTVAANFGYRKDSDIGGTGGVIFICPHCAGPNIFDRMQNRTPDAKLGSFVDHVPSELSKLYEEARACTSIGCHTAAVLLLRKMLMNIAVNKGADAGRQFVQYVEYLSDKGFVPPDGKDWVDHIRRKGNEATHEIAEMSVSDSEDLVDFVEMLLRYIYEFSGRLAKKGPAKLGP
ncbi:MAG: DUF4145 domain-containing protein [Parvularculaceae bacterium]